MEGKGHTSGGRKSRFSGQRSGGSIQARCLLRARGNQSSERNANGGPYFSHKDSTQTPQFGRLKVEYRVAVPAFQCFVLLYRLRPAHKHRLALVEAPNNVQQNYLATSL